MPGRKQTHREENESRARSQRKGSEPTPLLEGQPLVTPPTTGPHRPVPPATVPRLQRTVGNRAVNQILARPRLQRDLATALPAEAPEAQPDLTDAEINQALFFNRTRYDADSTRLIQDIIGAEPTGTWDRESVLLVAQLQEDYGLQKDGMVGNETFRFIDQEQGAEGDGTGTDESLLLFKTPTGNVAPYYKNIGGSHFAEGHFDVEAQFSERGNCADWEYRQEIRGNAWGQKPGFNQANLNHFFNLLPAGQLTPNWEEDGNTGWAGINYGHRLQAGRANNPINRYEDHTGSPDQRNGCIYKGEDWPKVSDAALASGDTITLELEFKGSIYRRNTDTGRLEHVTTHRWTVNGNVVVP